MQKPLVILCVFLFFLLGSSKAQTGSWFTPADSLNKARFWTLNSTLATGYTGVVIGLNNVWYAQYPRSKFHFFNDLGEWEDMDKAGHFYTAYFESLLTYKMYRWAGVKDDYAAWVGFGAGTLFQATLETLDGFSEEWGFSWGDIAFNTAGSSLFIVQHKLWEEQRIKLKISAWRGGVPDYEVVGFAADGTQTSMMLSERVSQLYGNAPQEILLKDYNAITVWASVNPSSFIKSENSKFPKWLNVAIGYGAGNVYGGFENEWTSSLTENGMTQDYVFVLPEKDFERYRQFYLSLDVDLTKIKTNSAFLKTLFTVFNIIKIPAPALEVNTRGQVKFHPVIF